MASLPGRYVHDWLLTAVLLFPCPLALPASLNVLSAEFCGRVCGNLSPDPQGTRLCTRVSHLVFNLPKAELKGIF